jgi:hypothetical protein
MRSSTTFGDHQPLHIKPFTRDRFGVYSGVVEWHVFNETYDKPNWSLCDINSCPDIGLAIPCIKAEREFNEKMGMGIYRYTMEGQPLNDTSDSYVYCTMDGTDREEPILTHPLWSDLKTLYGAKPVPGSSTDWYFPPMMPDGKTANPLYGATSYLTVGMTWTRVYCSTQIPVNLLSKVDTVCDPIGHPAQQKNTASIQPPQLIHPRNWLKIAPSIQERGNMLQITERWLASGKNGWNKDVYNAKSAAGGAGP